MPPVAQEAQEQPGTPPAAVPHRGGLPAHLWKEPDYIILDGDDDDKKNN